jgi:hypothetical protein
MRSVSDVGDVGEAGADRGHPPGLALDGLAASGVGPDELRVVT